MGLRTSRVCGIGANPRMGGTVEEGRHRWVVDLSVPMVLGTGRALTRSFIELFVTKLLRMRRTPERVVLLKMYSIVEDT